MFIGWCDCRTSGDLRADTSSCTDKPSMQDCTEEKKNKKKTLKHVVKQLTPLWVTHTETWHITSCCVCKQCTPHFLWLFHNQKKVYLDRSAYRSSEKLWFFQAAQQTLCVLFVLVWASRWWSDPAVNHCVASFFVFVLMWCTAATNN